VPNFRHRLTRAQQRIYDRSNATPSIRLTATPRLRRAVAALPEILAGGDRSRVQRVAQAVADEISGALRVSRVQVRVDGVRPANARGELHGLYTPGGRARTATIKVWMMTAKREQVVAFKTFLRTLLHEICHHLDYVHLRLADSFHTDGFYQRESSLFYQIGAPAAAAAGASRGARGDATGNSDSDEPLPPSGGAAGAEQS
jgi:hypothetical protein